MVELIQGLNQILKSFQQDQVFCEGLSFNQFSIIHYVNKQPGLTMQELTKSLNVEKSTLSRTILPLINQSFIEKRTSHEDSRKQLLFITPEGSKQHKVIEQCISAFFDQGQNNLTEQQKQTMQEGLLIFINSFKPCC